uniref:Uncharacterized protein n=1 Tax=Lactuca sativa TaxID=4236 RepID=A0A9R1US48_LACSA|nr:hypothetical protein LSAT_V11C800400620 [Lactuca sativa]
MSGPSVSFTAIPLNLPMVALHMVPAFYISCSDMINKCEVLTKERSCAVDVQHLVVAMKKEERYLNFKKNKRSYLSRLYNRYIFQNPGHIRYFMHKLPESDVVG